MDTFNLLEFVSVNSLDYLQTSCNKDHEQIFFKCGDENLEGSVNFGDFDDIELGVGPVHVTSDPIDGQSFDGVEAFSHHLAAGSITVDADDAPAVAVHPVDVIQLRYKVDARRHLDA